MSDNKGNFNKKDVGPRVNQLNAQVKHSMLSRVLMAIIMIVIVVPCLIIGDYLFFVLILFLALVSTHELIKAPQSLEHKYKNVIYFFAYFMVIIMIYWIFVKNNLLTYEALKKKGLEDEFVFSLQNGFQVPQVSLSALIVSIAFFFLMVIIDNKFTINEAFYFITMLFVVAIAFQCTLFLRYFPFNEFGDNKELIASNGFKYWQSAELLIFVLLADCMNDAGAYFVGVLFGKHHMTPIISPKKTWEGFFGGVIISFVSSLSFALIFDELGMPLANFLDIDHWYNVLVLSLMIPITATLGDLMFSAIKRNFGIKDFGTILKSHGGILDRIDSIVFTSIASSLLIVLMDHNWGILL